MKRPRFFEDLERSISGDPDPEPAPNPEMTPERLTAIQAQIALNDWQSRRIAQSLREGHASQIRAAHQSRIEAILSGFLSGIFGGRR